MKNILKCVQENHLIDVIEEKNFNEYTLPQINHKIIQYRVDLNV